MKIPSVDQIFIFGRYEDALVESNKWIYFCRFNSPFQGKWENKTEAKSTSCTVIYTY